MDSVWLKLFRCGWTMKGTKGKLKIHAWRFNVFCGPAALMTFTFTGSWGLQTHLHKNMNAIIVNAKVQISIREMIHNMTTHKGFYYCCVAALFCFFLNMSALTEIVTPAVLKITKVSNRLHSWWKDFSLPAMRKKWVWAKPKPDVQVEQTRRTIDQRSSICSWNWAREFSARLVIAARFWRQT